MNVKTISRSLLGGLISTLIVANSAFASGTLTGQIGVQVTIGTGCTVSNGTSLAGANSWGTIDFGDYGDLANAVNSGMVGSGGASAVSVICSAGTRSTLTLNGGQHSATLNAATIRTMENDTGAQIPYRLYSDSGRSNEIQPNGQISITGTGNPQEIPIYARILPEDQTATAPTAGVYNDIITATLTW